MDDLNTVNDVQSGNVDAQEEMSGLSYEPEEREASSEEPSHEEPFEGNEEEAGGDDGGSREEIGHTGSRDFERDHQFAEIRRQAEAAGRRKAMEEFAPVTSALSSLGYEGNNPRDLADSILAEQQDMSLEEFREARLNKEREALSHPAVREMAAELDYFRNEARNAEIKATTDRDIADLKKAFPDCKAEKVQDLGIEYIKLRAAGVDNFTAYQAVKAERERNTVPSVGKTGSSSMGDKTFYSSEEIDNICSKHPEMLEDPKILNKINASIAKM